MSGFENHGIDITLLVKPNPGFEGRYCMIQYYQAGWWKVQLLRVPIHGLHRAGIRVLFDFASHGFQLFGLRIAVKPFFRTCSSCQ